MKNVLGVVALFLVLGTSAGFAAPAGKCQTVTGKGQWTLIPSANDPLGRVLGPTTGNLKAAVSASLISLAPNPDGSLAATSEEVWVVGPTDVIRFAGAATFTPVADAPIGTVSDALTLTAVGGTGKYAGVTGTIHVTGTGYNLFGPAAGPGNTFFDVNYRGSICVAD